MLERVSEKHLGTLIILRLFHVDVTVDPSSRNFFQQLDPIPVGQSLYEVL